MSALKFKSLTIQNFMSYGNNETEVDLDFNRPMLIVGENHDAMSEGELDSNGAGKSAILDALAFALYDKTISLKEKGDLINNINKKNLKVSVTFEKNGIAYKVVRLRKTKTKADVEFWVMENDEYKNKTLDSIANTNNAIVDIIGFPFDIFSRMIVFSASFEAFLELPSRHASKPNQTEIMEELFSYKELSEKANVLKEKIKHCKQEFNHLTDLQTHLTNEKERYDTQLSHTIERRDVWTQEHDDKINELNEEISRFQEIDFDNERENLQKIEVIRAEQQEIKHDITLLMKELESIDEDIKNSERRQETIKELTKKISVIEKKVDFEKEKKLIGEIDQLSNEIQNVIKPAIKSLTSEIALISDKIKKLQRECKHLADEKCPYCEQAYEDAKNKLTETNESIESHTNNISELQHELDELNQNLVHNETEQKALLNESMFDGSMKALNDLQTKYATHKSQLETLLNESNNVPNENDKSKIETDLEKSNNEYSVLTDNEKTVLQECIFSSIADLERQNARFKSLGDQIDLLKKETNPHNDTIKELNEMEFDDDKTEQINDLENTIKHQEFLLKLLTKKDSFIRKKLLDRCLPFLNKQLMHYLSQLGLPHRVEFKPDMSAHISQFGTEINFSSLSSGQRARINLALAFAFRDVLQLQHGKISFCMLDECLDTGLGNVGVQLAANMIKKIAIDNNMSMLIISHRDEISNLFDKKMLVKLKNGFSTINSN